jgi:protein O-GlcNAc transferase
LPRLERLLDEAAILERNGSLAEALKKYRAALPLLRKLGGTEARYNLGVVLQRLGMHEEALASFRATLEAQPGSVDALLNAGSVLHALARYDGALECCLRVLEISPGLALAHNNAGNALEALGRPEEALGHFKAAVASAPGYAVACDNLGNLLKKLGRIGEAIDAYREGMQGGDARLYSNYLLALNYAEDCSEEALALEHRRFGERFGTGKGRPPLAREWPRRLRIGYVSPDLREHSVAYFVEPLLERHDRDAFEVIAYYGGAAADATTRRLRALCDRWRDCVQLSDAEFAQQVRADRADILVDLAGHTGGGRLLAFAERPAPLQLSFLGYPGTTGLSAIDNRITDAHADPSGSEHFSCERLLRPWPTYFCYRPPGNSPEPAASPGSSAITFGCFNNVAKLSDGFLAAAAQVLAAVPEARLVLKTGGLESQRARLAHAGLDAARIELRGFEPSTASHLAQYHAVDIALDTFPYNGATTTCEALWMGVPVVTLEGRRHAGRMGASLLHALGLPELVCGDAAQYVATCIALARNRARLDALKLGLRARLQASPLMDETGYTRALEAAYTEAWTRLRASSS